MPKIELHLHIEGSLEPEMMFAFAERNGIEIPFKNVEEVRAAYNFSNLQDFLDIYYQGMNVLQTEQDFYDLTWAYLEKAKSQNVVRSEIFFDPQGHTDRGLAFETPLNGITRALDDAREKLGVDSSLIMCFLRHLDEESAFQTLAQALPYKDKILGVGLDSSENGNPPEKFARVFAACRDAGFKLVAHAGEEGPPEYVWNALQVLNVDRIDHGNRSMEDAELVRELRSREIGMTVCPLSNLKLCGVARLEDHPLADMLDNGLKVSVNSDDPSYFGGYMTENYQAIAHALDLRMEDIVQVAENAITTSFASDAEKKSYKADLYRYVADFSRSVAPTTTPNPAP